MLLILITTSNTSSTHVTKTVHIILITKPTNIETRPIQPELGQIYSANMSFSFLWNDVIYSQRPKVIPQKDFLIDFNAFLCLQDT